MSYARAVQKYDEKSVETQIRTDYRCKAHGCPNAGTMERDLCFFHLQAEPLRWPAVTEQISATWPEMANWGRGKVELEATKAAVRRANLPARKAVGLSVMDVS